MAPHALSPSFAAAYAQSAYVPAGTKRFPTGLAWAVLLHVVVGYAVLSGKAAEVIKVIQKPLQAVVIQEVTLPPPPPPAPQPVQPPKPVPQTVVDAPKPVPPAPVALPTMPATTHPAPMAAAVPVAQAAPEATSVKPAPAPAPVEHAPQAPSLEGEYVGKLRATIDAAKRYPTGRQASQQRPQGSVKLWFVLTRSGVLVDVGVIPGDAPFILEDAAKAAVRRSSFPAFPASVWPGDEQHKFTTELNFVPPSGS